MIKIVNEVDEVANDPRLATDPTRVWMYLDPFVFGQLLPGAAFEGRIAHRHPRWLVKKKFCD